MDPSDEELLARYRAERGSGDEQRWILELLQRYHNSLAYWCLRATGDAEAAERLGTGVLEEVRRQLDSYPEGTSFAVWLFDIVAKHSTPEMKKRLLRQPRPRNRP